VVARCLTKGDEMAIARCDLDFCAVYKRTTFNFDLHRQPQAYYVATVFFVVALLTKTVTATLPAALLVIFWWQRRKLSWRRDVAPLLPWFALGAGCGLAAAGGELVQPRRAGHERDRRHSALAPGQSGGRAAGGGAGVGGQLKTVGALSGAGGASDLGGAAQGQFCGGVALAGIAGATNSASGASGACVSATASSVAGALGGSGFIRIIEYQGI